ncbi:MAG: cytochrome c biogenesis protein CcdA [Actinomycetota bacterium]
MSVDLQVFWAPALAFAAGLVSFASPCVLPLVPGYVAFVAGTETGTGAEHERRRSPILLFVLGFSTVFVALGAFAGTLLPIIRSPVGTRLAGLVIIGFGAVMLAYALHRGAWLLVERRPLLARIRPGRTGSFALGMAFAAGWTPCIGPVLAAILSIATIQGASVKGALLLGFYSLGLGVPFVLVGFGLRRLLSFLDVLKRHYRAIAGVSGLFMVAIGLLLVSGLWMRLMSPLLRWVGGFTPVI